MTTSIHIHAYRRCVVPTVPRVPSDNARAVADGMDKASNRVQKAVVAGDKGFWSGVCKFCGAPWPYETLAPTHRRVAVIFFSDFG